MTIALNILYDKEKQICLTDISKINSNCEKQNYTSKQIIRRMAFSCREKPVYIFKRNNVRGVTS